MYSKEQRDKAIELFVRYDLSAAPVVREIGYPCRETLAVWYREYLEEQKTGVSRDCRGRYGRYTQEQKEIAIRYYSEHGRSLRKTIRAIGYPSHQLLSQWLDELAPGEKRRFERPEFTGEQKREAAIALVTRRSSASEIAEAVGCGRETLYAWKRKILGKEVPTVLDDREELPDDPEELAAYVGKLKDQIRRLELERDILEGTVEIVKKDPSADVRTLSNKEKATLIGAMREKHPLNELLGALGLPKSSYFYQRRSMNAPDKYLGLRDRIRRIFVANGARYGYRRIRLELKREGETVSARVVARIMAEEGLIAKGVKRKRRWSSYAGEPSDAPKNLVNRDFNANAPNEKWLTDITEFGIPAGKVYLSPIVDCFDGMVVSWTIGTSPSADLANTMLENAVATLHPGESPLIHSDRGGHYRWPRWIELVEDACLVRSMSKKGCCADNSACEGLFGRLKNEFFYGEDWSEVSIDEFMVMLDSYLHWYNEARIKVSLDGMSPLEYRRDLGLAA